MHRSSIHKVFIKSSTKISVSAKSFCFGKKSAKFLQISTRLLIRHTHILEKMFFKLYYKEFQTLKTDYSRNDTEKNKLLKSPDQGLSIAQRKGIL